MAEHVLETRIQLRYDTLNNWMSSTLILKKGEVAVAEATYDNTIETTNSTPQHTPPAIGLKVGDGYHRFDELPWIQAVAGDVYNWAKQSTKPTYDASEITNLAQYIETHSSSTGGDGTVSPRLYQLYEGTGANDNKFYLQYKTSENNEWITDTSAYIDLTDLAKLVAWIGQDLTRFPSIGNRTAEHIQYEIGKLDYIDTAQSGYYVSRVSETDGKIAVERQQLNYNDITGTVDVPHGGTGVNTIPQGQVVIGNGTDAIQTVPIARTIDTNTDLVPNYLVKAYVDEKTAGLTGAMHYIGEATVAIDLSVNAAVDPRISGYNFSQARPGDVILSNRAELVWTGSAWRLLGDEGSYAIRGSIKDADIDAEADIQQSKILNLTSTLAQKVDKVAGKQLSSNDYTNEEKNKLEGIQTGAQVNTIEHIFVNDIERPIVVIDGKQKSVALSIDVFDEAHANKLDNIQAGAQVNTIEHIYVNGEEAPIGTIENTAKSVNITFIPFTEEEQAKLQGIEAQAEKNKVETILINGTEYFPNEDKQISITLDQAALNLSVIEGAVIPGANGYENVDINNNKKLVLARIAKTGNIKDVIQSNDEYITLYCGTSTEVI